MSGFVNEIMSLVKQRDPYAPEFHQAVLEVVESLEPCIEKEPLYRKHKVVERIVEPERESYCSASHGFVMMEQSKSTAVSVLSLTPPLDHIRADCVFTRQ